HRFAHLFQAVLRALLRFLLSGLRLGLSVRSLLFERGLRKNLKPDVLRGQSRRRDRRLVFLRRYLFDLNRARRVSRGHVGLETSFDGRERLGLARGTREIHFGSGRAAFTGLLPVFGSLLGIGGRHEQAFPRIVVGFRHASARRLDGVGV